MDLNSIQIAVRVRPWHPVKEAPFITHVEDKPFFLGDGNFASSPRKAVSSGSLREVVEVIDGRALDFDRPESGSETRRGQPGAKRYKNRRYVFDHVFKMDTQQEEVFEKTVKPLLDGVLDGYNATAFAYGATGCGKTHTISGTVDDPGLIIRIMRELFQRIEDDKDKFDTYIELSMVEIYNELIRDLLNDDFPATPRGGLRLLENEKHRVTLDRVTLKRPKSVDEVLEMVLLGNQRRSTSFTESNSSSSRSHAVLQINVGRNERGHQVDLERELVRQCSSSATLSIIDLAGSERAAATRNMGDRMKEGANINKSLLALSSCISALCARPVRGVAPHVPYRNSKLTRMLKFSLGGNCRTVMIVCVSPSSRDLEDTHNTLSWADKAKNVSTKISRNTQGVDVRVSQYIKAIHEKDQQIQWLEKQLNDRSETQSKAQMIRLEQARHEARQAVGEIKVEVDRAMAVIQLGATRRAMWDGAEMRIASLKRRLEALDDEAFDRSPEDIAKERAYLEGLIASQNNAFRFNTDVQTSLQRESATTTKVDSLLSRTEERKFGDHLDSVDNVKLNVALEKSRMDKSVSAAREKGYRETVQQQAEIVARAADQLWRFVTSLQVEVDSLAGVAIGNHELQGRVDKLRSLAMTSDAALESIFASSTSVAPPPLLSPPSNHAGSTPSRPTRDVSAPRSALSRVPPVKPSPAIRRLKAASRGPLGSPGRLRAAVAVASPRRKGPRNSLIPKPAAKKVFRWKDEAGEGELEAAKTASDFSSEESPGVVTSGSASGDGEDEWEEIKSDEEKPAPQPTISLGSPTSKAPATTTGGIAPPMPAWKKNRIMLGKGLRTLHEDSESQSSPETGPAKSRNLGGAGGLMGPPSRPPQRPGPLAERHTVPAAGNSSFSSISFGSSTLFKPTAASASKAVGNGSSPPTAAAGGTKGAALGLPRRMSTLGPVRNERRTHRSSMMPLFGNSLDPSNNTSASVPSLSLAGMAPIPLSSGSGSPQAINAMATMSPPRALNRRTSTLGISSLASKPSLAPRPSFAFGGGGANTAAGGGGGGSSLPRGLSSRPSMSGLRAGLPAGGGDTAGRAAWR